MAQLFQAGEIKKRPGVYYRYSNHGKLTAKAMDGVNAIVLKASWGPYGVTSHTTAQSIIDTYGQVPAALMLKKGGAQKVYICRAQGTGGKQGTGQIGSVGSIKTKYEGTLPLSVKIQVKPGDDTKKQAIVLNGTKQVELFEFAVDETDEGNNIKEAVKKSKYITVEITTAGVITEGTISLTGGTDPTVSTENYADGIKALEPYRYNVLTTDTLDAAVVAIVKAYMETVETKGKLCQTVIGAPSTEALQSRLEAAKACNSKNVIFTGSGFYDANGEAVDGELFANYAAGVISSTPSSQSIVHTVIEDATDVTERLTNEEYEEAIDNGLLLLSVGPDGQVWFDTGINTLTKLADNEDEGWKKIKRTKVRYELMDRIDRVVAPLVGRINCDPDGIAAVIQAGMGIIAEMVAERKILPGATMIEDPDYTAGPDSAWFLIAVDDIDSLEKIYLHYQFRYSQNA